MQIKKWFCGLWHRLSGYWPKQQPYLVGPRGNGADHLDSFVDPTVECVRENPPPYQEYQIIGYTPVPLEERIRRQPYFPPHANFDERRRAAAVRFWDIWQSS